MSYKLNNEYKQLKRYESILDEIMLDNYYRVKPDKK